MPEVWFKSQQQAKWESSLPNPNLLFDFSTRTFKRKIIDVDNIFYIAVQIEQM